MKKTLRVLGAIFIILIVIGMGGFFILAREGATLDVESHDYVDSSVMAIITDWDQNELRKRMTAESQDKYPPQDMDRLFAKLRTLGRIKTYDGSRGQARLGINPMGKIVTANYEATANFDTGPAQITLNLIKGIDGWRIQSFYVFSKALL
jgi:hypothetical protein